MIFWIQLPDHLVIYIAFELFIISPVWDKFQWKKSDLFLLWEVLLICQVFLGILKNKFLGTPTVLEEKNTFP